MSMKFDLSKVEFSREDIRRNIRIPNKMTKELSELIGIITGDGCIGIYKGKGYIHHEIKFSGHRTEEYDYYTEHVNGLFNFLFNASIKLRVFKSSGNELSSRIGSKAILSFLSRALYLPTRNKASVTKIPEYIKSSSPEIKTAFIRGLADTDFCIAFKKKHKNMHYYPVISVRQKSKTIIEDVSNALKELGFYLYTQYNMSVKYQRGFTATQHAIYISGEKNLSKWINLIGFNNPKHMTKYLVWKKFGQCPPYTTLVQRRKTLITGLGGFEPPTPALGGQCF